MSLKRVSSLLSNAATSRRTESQANSWAQQPMIETPPPAQPTLVIADQFDQIFQQVQNLTAIIQMVQTTLASLQTVRQPAQAIPAPPSAMQPMAFLPAPSAPLVVVPPPNLVPHSAPQPPPRPKPRMPLQSPEKRHTHQSCCRAQQPARRKSPSP